MHLTQEEFYVVKQVQARKAEDCGGKVKALKKPDPVLLLRKTGKTLYFFILLP